MGALTSYTYRFRARPWDIEDAGSVCTLCPSQCNVKFTVRDERVLRVLARDNEAVDDGWLCDKGRFAFQMFNSEERITQPMVRAGDGSLSPLSWQQAIEQVAGKLKGAGSLAAALVGGSSSNEEGWLAQRLIRGSLGGSAIASSPSPVDRRLLAELSRPELGARMSDLDYAGAICVIGADPLHEMPILDLRIRKAVRRNGTKLLVASERPTALDGGAHEAIRYAPGDAGAFLNALRSALAGEGAEGPHAEDAKSVAEHLRDVQDPVIVWGERLWRSPGAVAALHDIARSLDMHQRLGTGLLEVPEEANARGLREAGAMAGAGPGLSSVDAGPGAAEIKRGLADHELDALVLVNADPVRTYPDGAGWRKALAGTFVVAISMFDDESTRHADIVLPAESYAEKEGTVTHPDGRLQRLRPNVPHPEEVRPGWWVLTQLLAGVGDDVGYATPEEVFNAACETIPFYGATGYEEIGGQGLRWSERDPGSSWVPTTSPSASGESLESPAPESQAAAPGSEAEEAAVDGEAVDRAPEDPAHEGGGGSDAGLLLGTYRDLWASEVTERNPSLRFLMPTQRLELAPSDAEGLGLGQGDPVTVSVNGDSVEAVVAIKGRMRPGGAFLIEGTSENNGNVLPPGRLVESRSQSARCPPRTATGPRTGTGGSRSSRRRCPPAEFQTRPHRGPHHRPMSSLKRSQ